MGWIRIPCILVVMHHHNGDWLMKKCTGKKGFIQKWKQRKEKIKLEKMEKMKSELRKQGLIVDDVKAVKVDAIEQNPIEPKIKYYGMDTLPAV